MLTSSTFNVIHPIKFRGATIHLFRDDLFPAVGGGNKARKVEFIAEEILLRGCNAVVTTGGIQSNHCRAVAINAAQNGWKCKLILHGDKERYFGEGGNAKLIRLTGAEVEFAEPSEIAYKMEKAMDYFRSAGYSPYYVTGGGHNLKGGEAYVEAVSGLASYGEREKWYPEYIFLATGTGSTHAGILAGLDKAALDTKVIGISIARTKERAESIVEEFYHSLKIELQIEAGNREVIVYDDYLAGGYEACNQDIKKVVEELARETGVFTDPTYTGKAFWGMVEIIKAKQISGQVLFWHTGGLNNLLASTNI